MEIGHLARFGAAGIHHHQSHPIGVGLVVFAEPVKDDRVTFGCIGPDREQAIRQLQIVIATGGPIGPKAA